MRRSTFERLFREEFEKRHGAQEDGYANHVKADPIRLLLKRLGLTYRPHEWGYCAEVTGPDYLAEIKDLSARLARLECPKHDYRSDACVKCGAPRKGAK